MVRHRDRARFVATAFIHGSSKRICSPPASSSHARISASWTTSSVATRSEKLLPSRATKAANESRRYCSKRKSSPVVTIALLIVYVTHRTVEKVELTPQNLPSCASGDV